MTDRVVWAGRYAVYDELATGGMATVYLAARLGPASDLPRVVALKKLAAQFAKQPEFVAMFLDEAHLAARIRHPNVVTTYEFLRTDEGLGIVMDFVLGQSLLQLLRTALGTGSPAPLPVAGSIIAGALEGLHAAHEIKDDSGRTLGLVHRDMSPHNVIVGKDGIARVIDFGIAKAAGRLQTTDVGVLKGKFAYMAPEQIRGAAVDRKTDVYGAGVVLWEALTGRRLFKVSADEIDLTRRGSGETLPPLPSSISKTIPREVDDIVRRALDVDPEKRFMSAREMAHAVRSLMPIADKSEVAAWVDGLAGGDLALLDAKRAEIEASFGDVRPVPSPRVSQPLPVPRASSSPKVASEGAPLIDIPDLIAPPSKPLPPPPPSRRAKPRSERSVDSNDVFAGGSAEPIALELQDLPPARAPSSGPGEPEGPRISRPSLRRRRRSRVGVGYGVAGLSLLVAIGGVVLGGPGVVKDLVVSAAARRGLGLAVERIDARRSGMALINAHFTLPGCPEVGFTAAEVDVDLDGSGSAVGASFKAFDLIVRGDLASVARHWQAWQEHAGLALPLEGRGGHVIWSDVFTTGTEIEGLDVTLGGSGARNAGLSIETPSLVINVPRGHLGPWRLRLDTAPGQTQAWLALDPTVASGPPEATVMARPSVGTTLSVSIPRGSPFKAGLPAELFGFSSAESLEVALTAHIAGARLEAEGRVGLFDLRVPHGASMPVDLIVDGKVRGDTKDPLIVRAGSLTIGKGTSPVAGTVTLASDGIRVELSPQRLPGSQATSSAGTPPSLVLDTREWTRPSPAP